MSDDSSLSDVVALDEGEESELLFSLKLWRSVSSDKKMNVKIYPV